MNIARLLKQTAVYWSSPVADGYGGYTFSQPVEISVRWEDKQEKYISLKGEEKISRSIVYSEQDFDVGGYLMLGVMDDLDSEYDPQKQENALLIQAISKVPSIKSDKYLRSAWL